MSFLQGLTLSDLSEEVLLVNKNGGGIMNKMSWSKRCILLLGVLILIGTFAGMVAANEGEVDRIAGENRYETAAKLAKAAFPNGTDAVIIARGEAQGEYADGLSSATLAGHLNAPILLTQSAKLPEVTEQALKELGARTAYLVGGEQAISADVEAVLRKLGLTTKRIAGENRYDTAAQIARHVAQEGKLASFAFIVSGHAPADSMVSGPVAFNEVAPILQVGQGEVPETTRKALQSLGITDVFSTINYIQVRCYQQFQQLSSKKYYYWSKKQ